MFQQPNKKPNNFMKNQHFVMTNGSAYNFKIDFYILMINV